MPPGVRQVLVRRLAAICALSVVGQASAYLVVTSLFGFLVTSLTSYGHINFGHRSGPIVCAIIAMFLVSFLLALGIGFFGARTTLRAMRAAVPAHLPTPTTPVAWAAVSAGALILCLNVLRIVTKPDDQTLMTWALVALRDLIVLALLWYGAMRSVTNARGVALAAAIRPSGSSLSQRA